MKYLFEQHLLDSSILIIDNEAIICAEIAQYFSTDGFVDIRTEFSAAAAIIAYQQRKAQIIIADMHLQGAGLEFIRWLCNDHNNMQPVVIGMATYFDINVVAAYAFKVKAFFRKPFNLAELVASCKYFGCTSVDENENTIINNTPNIDTESATVFQSYL